MKRILTVQDISCIGKCSLTVALPIISAMGVETAVIPTAVLSTHTAFKSFTFRDLTSDILPIVDHWKKEDFAFDGIYTGYLGTAEQIDLVRKTIRTFKTENCRVIVDPVMADHGKLYAGFTEAFAAKMATLCAEADVIVPNLTEAAFLLGAPYKENPSEDEVREILRALAQLGAGTVVLTGVRPDAEHLGVMAYDKAQDRFFSYAQEYVPASFHGTGDIFASCLCGAMARGLALEDALRIAVDFTVECIRISAADKDRVWYGVQFETALPKLIEKMGAI